MQKFFWTMGCLSLAMATSLSPVWSNAQTPKAQAATRTPITLSLLAINDFHGNILPPSAGVLVPDASNATGTRVSAGGAAYLATLIKNLKQHNPKQTLVLGDGDLIGATPLASGLFHDEPTIDILNQIGLDLSTVGNHEFDDADIFRALVWRIAFGDLISCALLWCGFLKFCESEEFAADIDLARCTVSNEMASPLHWASRCRSRRRWQWRSRWLRRMTRRQQRWLR